LTNAITVFTAQPLKSESSLSSSSKRVFYAAKSTKTKGERPGIHSPPSSTPFRRLGTTLSNQIFPGGRISTESRGRTPKENVSNPSRNHVSAVIVPPLQPSPEERRRIFLENLRVLNGVTLVNTVDDTSPPLDFEFTKDSVLGKNVTRTTKDFMSGCTCRVENGRSIGCEYLYCQCLDDSQENDQGKKVFPYAAGKDTLGCLRNFCTLTFPCSSLPICTLPAGHERYFRRCLDSTSQC